MIDTTANKKELKEIKQQGKAVAAFIGAGCSKVLNIPVWDDLLIALNDEFKAYKNAEEVLAAIKNDDYPIVASNIESKASSKAVYKEIIQKFSKPTSCYFTSLHIELIRWTKTIVTTNYDKSFEETLDSLLRINSNGEFKFNTYSVGNLGHIGLGQNRHVYHIHGNNEEADFIFTYQSYKQQYDNPLSGVSLLIPVIFSEFTVLFVGFSFNDTFFVDFLQDTFKRIALDTTRKVSLPNHYCIISDNIFKDYLFAGELTDIEIYHIDDLIKEGVLKEDKLSSISESVFRFTKDAEMLIHDLSIDDKKKKNLLNKISGFRSNEEKLKLFEELNIKPITFKGNNYLEIETIIRDLNEPFNPIADSYAP